MIENNLAAKIRVAMIHGRVDALKECYRLYGDELVNEWMCDNNAYYKLYLSGHVRCIDFVKTKLTPKALLITEQMLITSIKEGDTRAIRVASEQGRLNELLFETVACVHHRTFLLLQACHQYRADFTKTDANGNTLLHALAQSTALNKYTREHSDPNHYVSDFYWAIDKLVSLGLSLDTKNNAGETPEGIAQECNNRLFLSATQQFKQAQQDEANEGKLCLIL